ncbi:MAG: hypothetical protein A2748_03665 [Candidatus Wildermuthbacteria bacterium RIFCSPHIGHO2_01_FULL_45_20]|nr:MAG: hypothetical protein A2748_03665 [Candidatus Wildermuthbacteria bacterium RIFCSPHIGHO2_01_FULL_45_20]
MPQWILFTIYGIWLALPVFWFIRTAKMLLFWLYLWQLKDYHVGRFLAHFSTAKGKQLLTSKLIAVKLIFLVFLLFVWVSDLEDAMRETWIAGFFALTIALYGLEGMKTLADMAKRRLLLPVSTKKTVLLGLVLIFFELVFLGVFLSRFVEHGGNEEMLWNLAVPLVLGLIAFDIAVPFAVAVVVLALQPFAVMARNRIIRKAHAKRNSLSHLIVIGITGSYGKTTTKEILSHILSTKFQVAKTHEHQNSEIGVSRAVLSLTESDQVFVCEMGAYNKGGIALLAGIAKPLYAVITGVNEQHLATFGSMENLLSAEGGKELIAALPENGMAAINGNSAFIWKVYQEMKEKKNIRWKKVFSRPDTQMHERGVDLWAEKVHAWNDRVTCEITEKGGKPVRFSLPLIGAYHVENLLLACAVARDLGMSLEEISKAVNTLGMDVAAMRLLKGENDWVIIESTYSANPDGVMAALEYLKTLEWQGRVPGDQHPHRFVVMPCLIELGSKAKEIHRRIGEALARSCDGAIITTRDYVEEIRKGAESANMHRTAILYTESGEEIYRELKKFAKPGDVILLEGRVPKSLMSLLGII